MCSARQKQKHTYLCTRSGLSHCNLASSSIGETLRNTNTRFAILPDQDMAVDESSSQSSRSRTSSPKVATRRRPELTRSSATAPSLVTSTVSRNDLAYLKSSPRATMLLSRMASYSHGREVKRRTGDSERRASPSPLRSKEGSQKKRNEETVQGEHAPVVEKSQLMMGG